MAETFDNVFDQDMLPVLEVRVLDVTKKNSFRVRRLTNFPIAESLQDMKTALQKFMPDITHVDNLQMGYVLDRNKKYTIETDCELSDAWQHFKNGYQMWLDPSPAKAASKRKETPKNISGVYTVCAYVSYMYTSVVACHAARPILLTQRYAQICIGKATPLVQKQRKEDLLLEEMDDIKKLHGNNLPPYKYRLWAEMILVGTATRESMPDVPMFTASPAKRPRRETMRDTLEAVGKTISTALASGKSLAQNDMLAASEKPHNSLNDNVDLRTKVLKQIRDLFELKQIGAITEEEYEGKKAKLLKDL